MISDIKAGHEDVGFGIAFHNKIGVKSETIIDRFESDLRKKHFQKAFLCILA